MGRCSCLSPPSARVGPLPMHGLLQLLWSAFRWGIRIIKFVITGGMNGQLVWLCVWVGAKPLGTSASFRVGESCDSFGLRECRSFLILGAHQTIICEGSVRLGVWERVMHTTEFQRRERRVLLQRSRQRLGPLIAHLTACTPNRMK